MTKVWNQSALQWKNYRTPTPRVVHGPVGDISHLDLIQRFHAENGEQVRSASAMLFSDAKCAKCGYHVCSKVPGKCVPAAPAAIDPSNMDWHQAKSAMREGKLVRVVGGRDEDRDCVWGFDSVFVWHKLVLEPVRQLSRQGRSVMFNGEHAPSTWWSTRFCVVESP